MSAKYDTNRIRELLRPVQLEPFFRIIKRQHRETPLDVVPAPSRFSDPQKRYAVLYASEAIRCGFWEAVARNRFARRKRRELPRADVDDLLIVTLRSIKPLSMVDLRGDGPVRIAAPTAVAHDANHAAGRALSAATYTDVIEADGFLYQSCFTSHACVGIFDRAFNKLQVVEIAPLAVHLDFLDALTDYEITLTTSFD